LAEERRRLDEFFKRLITMVLVEDTVEVPAKFGQLPTSKGSLYDYFLDFEKGAWIAWDWMVEPYQHDRNVEFSEILVPTSDTIRTEWLLSILNQIERPVLLVGDTGTSKTAIVSNFLRKLNPEKYVILNINFSSRTSSMDVQKILESSVEKRTKNAYGPPIGKSSAG
jgi:dynein heavy chain, axonemal